MKHQTMGTTEQTVQAELPAMVAQARAGDRAALEGVLSELAPSMERFARRMCRNVHDAEDVLQDALINVAEHLRTFEGRSSLSSWAFALTRSACARKRRGLKNQPPISDERVQESPDGAPSPETRVASQELASALSRALDQLSDEHREVILLRDIEGLSALEAASAMGISVDALKSRLHRAREALRKALLPLMEQEARAPKTGCPDVAHLWSKKLEGDLSQEDCSAMERHVETCSACASACTALKSALLACQQARTSDVPLDVQARVRSAIRAWAEQSGLKIERTL